MEGTLVPFRAKVCPSWVAGLHECRMMSWVSVEKPVVCRCLLILDMLEGGVCGVKDVSNLVLLVEEVFSCE